MQQLRADAERVGWHVATMRAVSTLLADVQLAPTVEDAVRAINAFRQGTVEPLVRKHFGDGAADAVDKALAGLAASLQSGERTVEAAVDATELRISRRLEQAEQTHEQAEQTHEHDDAAEDEEDDDVDDAAPAVADGAQLQWIARRQTGYQGNLTPRQAADLERFRELMYSTTDFRQDIERHADGADRLLLRYLRAECSKKRRFHLARSKARLVTSLQWRREKQMDTVLERGVPDFERFVALSAEFEIMDNEGRLWIFTRAAVLAMHLDLGEFTMDEWREHTAFMAERRMRIIRESSKERGYEVSAICMVYDLRGGIGLAARRMIPFVRVLNSISATHYPELVDMILVPGASRLFSGLYKLVAPILDPVTREKIRIYSSSKSDTRRFVSDMLEFIPREDLPKEFGGSSDAQVPMPLSAIQKGVPRPPDIVVDLDMTSAK